MVGKGKTPQKTYNTDVGIQVITHGRETSPGSNLYSVYGDAIDSSGVLIPGSRTKRTNVQKEEIPIASHYIVSKLSTRFRPRNTTRSNDAANDPANEESTLAKAINELKSRDYHGPQNRWSTITTHNYLQTILNKVEPFFSLYGYENFNLDELMQHIAETIVKHGNCMRHPRQIKQRVLQIVVNTSKIWPDLRAIYPDIPYIDFGADTLHTKMYQKEQIKALPHDIRRNFAQEILADINLKPKLARAAIVMCSGLARTSEAAAFNTYDLLDNGTYGVINITRQEIDGLRKDILKTKNACRRTILDAFGIDVVRRCNELIDDDTDTLAPVTSRDLNNYVRASLERAGLDEASSYMIRQQYICSDDYAYNNRTCAAESYILRRDRATILTTIGLSDEAVDGLLGHNNGNKYTNPDYYANLALQISRYHPLNTSHHTIESSDTIAADVALCTYTIEALDTQREITIVLEEPGDTIEIISDTPPQIVDISNSYYGRGRERKPIIMDINEVTEVTNEETD